MNANEKILLQKNNESKLGFDIFPRLQALSFFF